MRHNGGRMKESPLHPLHRRLGAQMAETGGWNMPQQFRDLIDEHLATRSACAIFDISNLGKFRLQGHGALDWLEQHLTNTIADCCDGHTLQSLILRDNGIILDRMTVLRESAGRFFLLGSASLADADFSHLNRNLRSSNLVLTNETDRLCGIAITGPDSQRVLRDVLHDVELPPPGSFCTIRRSGQRCTLSHCGLMAAGGFEFFCPAAAGIAWFEGLLAAGAIPCGHKTGEYLRISRGISDMDNDNHGLSPAAASLSHLCSTGKPYTGSRALQEAPPPRSRLIALRCSTPGHPLSPGDRVQNLDGGHVGCLTSATQAADNGHSYALAYVSATHTEPGTHLQIIADGHPIPAMVEAKDKVLC